MSPQPPPAPRTLAVLHPSGPLVRAVVADTAGPRPAVRSWREFPAADTAAQEAWLAGEGVEEVIGILAASAVICRTCTLPDAEPQALAQALALQAEAHLPGAAPAHRMGMAALPAASGETTRSGIICAWPEQARPILPETSRPITFCPDVACLAAILNGERPADPVLWLDGADGSVALALSHADGAVFRCARGSTGSLDAWRESAGRLLAETAISVNHTGAFTESLVGALGRAIASMPAGGSALMAPSGTIQSARARLAGTPDEAWWDNYGVAAGAILARVGHLACLTRLEQVAPVTTPSPFQRTIERLSNSVTATRLAVVCALVVMLWPLVAARLRLALLEMRLPELDAHVEMAREARGLLAMYEALGSESWPMTKLLADIACNTPEGIELDQIRIRHGEKVQVSGSSRAHAGQSAQALIAQMQENFRSSGLFDDITPTWGEPDTFNSYAFTLQARVVRPFRRHDYPIEQDYGVWTYADRLFGSPDPVEPPVVNAAGGGPAPEEPLERPVTRDAPAQGDDKESSPVKVRDNPGRRLSGSKGSRADPSQRMENIVVPPSQNIPDHYPVEVIATMSRDEAREAWGRVSQALKQANPDEATKERLWADWHRLRQRVRDLQDSDRAKEPAQR